ncbi:protein FAR1-RELATED SEQUENCE 5-like [Camellia sinensis]|uniref:protein FAR1-RELATED SEQUENCE 5-like n=1 Tax=Camellia sinensis TaxID=4442 RepID=UPI001036A8A1|nr:protein FAR1-RELATED SEQUENCE 5-like [Camellia sinensis]
MVDDAHRNDMVGDVERAILAQKFDSVEDGEDFYNAYAKAKGFSIRKSRFNTNKEGKVVSRLWLCSREGQRLPKYLDRVAEKSRAPKALTRVGCKAQFRIRYDADAGEGGKYVVTHFVADHNHELAEQHCVMYLRSHRSLNSDDKAQAMTMRNVGVKTSQIMDYMVNQSGSYENVGFIRTDLHNHIQAERRAEVEDANETIETYTWVLETFMEAMGNKAPVSVLTDGDKSMREAIRRVFPDARHRLCNWHLGKNAVSNVHISGFAHAFKQCMDMETDETKFEHGWTTMVEKFGLQTNSWVLETYEKRHMWAEAYMRGHFFAGMKSTQRSECMNAYFNPFLQHKLKLYEFVRHYDRALARIRYNEAGDDAETNNTFPGKLNVKDVFPLPDGQKCYYIHKYRVKDRSWIVTHSPMDAAMRCSCMKFESLGLPCCHMICVMKAENLTQIPPTCVLHRWTRAASKDGQQWPQPSIDSTTTQTARYGILCSSYNEMCFYASQSTEGFKDARDACLPMTTRMKELYERNLNGGNGDKGKHSFRRQFGVEDPDVVKTKGNPGRASSNCRRPRKCGNCKCIGHTKRTCPKVRFSRTVGNNSDADTPHITDREYNAESLPVRCKTGLVDPSTPHIKQRRLFFDVSPDSKQPVGQYGSVEAAVWKNDSNTIDEVNQQRSSNLKLTSSRRKSSNCGIGSNA